MPPDPVQLRVAWKPMASESERVHLCARSCRAMASRTAGSLTEVALEDSDAHIVREGVVSLHDQVSTLSAPAPTFSSLREAQQRVGIRARRPQKVLHSHTYANTDTHTTGCKEVSNLVRPMRNYQLEQFLQLVCV